MSKSNRPLTEPTIRQILFSRPIEDFVDAIDTPQKRTSKPKRLINDNQPMFSPEHRDYLESRLNTIDKIAPEKPLFSEDDLKRYHRLKEKQRQNRRLVKSTSVGSPGEGLFELDTRGISKAVDEFGSKKIRADKDKELIENAPDLEDFKEKKEDSDRNTELRDDLIRDIPESIDEERDRTDNKNQRYYNAGLRYISQGETEKAEEYLKKAGLTTPEINQELDRIPVEPKADNDGEKQEGQGLNSDIQDAKDQNLNGNSDLDQVNSGASSKSDQNEWEITLPSGEKMNKAMKRGLTNRDSMFTIQEALSNSILDTKDEQTRKELIKRLKNVSRVMLLNDGVPVSKVGQLSEQLFDEIMKRKRDNRKSNESIRSSAMEEANKEEEPTEFMKFLQEGKEFMNYWLKMWQHPIEGEKNLQLLEKLKDNETGQEPSWKELHNRWIQNNQDFIENQQGTSTTSESKADKKESVQENQVSLERPENTSKLDTLESTIDELEQEADSDQKDILENIRMEIQDMRSTGKI